MGKPAVHFDLVVGNKQGEKEFYNQVFEWTFQDGDSGDLVDYEFITGLTSPTGGISLPKDTPPRLILSIEVDDINVTRQTILDKGCQVSGIRNHPKGGKFAWFTDPEGILMGIYQNPT